MEAKECPHEQKHLQNSVETTGKIQFSSNFLEMFSFKFEISSIQLLLNFKGTIKVMNDIPLQHRFDFWTFYAIGRAPFRGERKDRPKIAKPHRKTTKYCNAASKFPKLVKTENHLVL